MTAGAPRANGTLAVAFDDVDFWLRGREKGLRNLWTPEAVLIHHQPKTRGADDTAERRRRFESEATRAG